MQVLESNRHRHNHLVQKQTLRAHIDQLSPNRQREFVALAQRLIANRSSENEVGSTGSYLPCLQAERQDVNH